MFCEYIECSVQTGGNPKSLSDTCKDIPGQPRKKRTLIEYSKRKGLSSKTRVSCPKRLTLFFMGHLVPLEFHKRSWGPQSSRAGVFASLGIQNILVLKML